MPKFVIPAAIQQDKPSGGTPDHIRQARSKQQLLESGGKRVSVNLTGEAVADLERIKARDGQDSTQAIISALKRHARR